MKETTANRLKEALELRGLKQADLVQLTGIGKSSISTYISGDYEPKQRNLYKLSKALNVSEAWLMGYDVTISGDDVSQCVDQRCLEQAKIIKDRRLELGLSLEIVADILDVNIETISKYETEGVQNLNINQIENLAKTLKVSPNYLTGWKKKQQSTTNAREQSLLNDFNKLNDLGQDKAVEYVSDLSDNPRYVRDKQENYIPEVAAAHHPTGHLDKADKNDIRKMNELVAKIKLTQAKNL